MCEPISTTTAIMMGLSAATTVAGLYSQRKNAKANIKAINEQNQLQADEIAKAAGKELTDRARSARRERSSMRAAASESGLNLQSGSFLAALQTSASNQYNDMGTIIQNERAQQRARQANARSEMARIEMPDYLTGALRIGASTYGAYRQDRDSRRRGSQRATG